MTTYKDLLDILQDAVVVSLGSHPAYVNGAYLRLHGLKNEADALSMPLSKFIEPDDLQTIQSRIDAAVRQQAIPGAYSYKFKRPDGSVRMAEATSVSIIWDGKPASLSVIRDMTDFKNAESDFSRLAAIVDSSSDSISTTSMDGKILTWNPGGLSIFGYSAEEAIGQNISIIFPKENNRSPVNIIDLIKRGERVEQEVVRRKKDGTLITVSIKVWALTDSDNNPVAIATISRDISERKRVEQELKLRTEELETLNRIANTLMQSGDSKERAKLALLEIKNLVRADRVTLRLEDGDKGLRLVAESDMESDNITQDVLPFSSKSLPVEAFKTGQPMVSNEGMLTTALDPTLSTAGLDSIFNVEISSMLAIPLSVKDQTLGVVTLMSRSKNYFQPDILKLAIPVCQGLGAILENVRLIELERQHSKELEALLRIANILAQSEPLTQRATQAISVMKEFAQADRVTLRLMSEIKPELILLAEVGTGMIGGTPRVLDINRPTIPGIAVREERTVVVNDTSLRPEFSAALSGAGIKAQAALVLKARGRILGSIAISSGETNHFTPERIVLLEAVCNGIGALLDNARLGESIAHTAAIVESSGDAIFRTDLDGIILSWNPGAERIYGYIGDEAIGRSVSIFMTPQGRDAVMGQTLADLRSGRGVKGAHRVHVRRDGKKIDVTINLSPILDEEGNVVGISSINTDISEFVALENQLRQAQKMEAIGRLSGGVAHDFNNLLTPILGFAELGLLNAAADSDERRYFEEILKAAERSREITKRLLSFSSQRPMEQTVFTLNELVTSSVSMLRTLVGGNVELTTALMPNPMPVKCDTTAIQQILVNFVANARDAMPKGGLVTIGTSMVAIEETMGLSTNLAPGDYCVLTVSDNGEGMTDEVKVHLFEPFFTTKEKGKGTGLGLAMSYGIAKASGGHIVIDSEVGLGTAAKVYIPITEEAQTVSTNQVQEVPKGTENVLLVEDEDSVRSVTRQILQRLGYTVWEAKNGLEAWHMYMQNPSRYEFVLSDVVMPMMDGMELAGELQRAKVKPKILLMSGYLEVTPARIDAMDKVPEFIQKPFTTKALAIKMRQVLTA